MKRLLLYKNITILVFCVALVAQTYNKAFVMADYYTNTSKYAKNCVNKAKPKMRCNGKCQMMKKLQQEEKKDKENPERKGEHKNDLVLSSKSFFASVPNYTLNFIQKFYPTLKGQKERDRSLEVFHPPSLFIAI